MIGESQYFPKHILDVGVDLIYHHYFDCPSVTDFLDKVVVVVTNKVLKTFLLRFTLSDSEQDRKY